MPLNIGSLQVLHIGFLAVAIIFFGLHNLKDYIENKTKECKKEINKIFRDNDQKEKRDILQSAINKKAEEAYHKLRVMVSSFQLLLFINILTLVFLSIEDLIKINILTILVYFLTILSFVLIIFNCRRFLYLYLYDPDSYRNTMQEEMLKIDNKRYDILFEYPVNEEERNEKIRISEILNPFK